MGVLVTGVGLWISGKVSDGTAIFGGVTHDFIMLQNGTYVVSEIGHPPGKYAIYAAEGEGLVTIDGIDYPLDDARFKEIKSGGAEPALYNFLYLEGPKIEVHAESRIIVQGDDTFEVGFIKN